MPFAGVAGPAGGVHPFGAVAGGVDMDADKDNVGHEIPGRYRGVESDGSGIPGAKVGKNQRPSTNTSKNHHLPPLHELCVNFLTTVCRFRANCG